jgi:SET domain-containing protein
MRATIIKDSEIEGRGVFAARDFKKGETVLVWCPKLISLDEAESLSEAEKNFLIKGSKNLLMQPPERYVNHSCEPNTEVVNNSDVALRDIKTGEEITSDYASTTSVTFRCHCGSKNCRDLIVTNE